MLGGFSALPTIYEFIYELLSGASDFPQIVNTVLVLAIMVAVLLLLVWLVGRYQEFRQNDAKSPRERVQSPRQKEPQSPRTFADAVELVETGTIRNKILETKMVDCAVPIEMMFTDADHGLVYQFELGHVSKDEVMDWLQVTRALELTEISEILEETGIMHDVICHPDADFELDIGGETLGVKLWNRAYELNVKMEEIDGIAKLRSACERHLRQNAPDMLPLPTW